MLSKTQQKTQSRGNAIELPMVINACSKMNGELILTTDTRVDGKIFGKVESDRNIIIGTAGYIKGFLRVNNLVCFGRIEGNIIVSGITVLHPGSSIFGNLYTKVLEVKEGAVITAHIITYEKLKAFDEAQLFLAEEMYTLQTNRMNIPAYSNKETTFIDGTAIEIGETQDKVSEQSEIIQEEIYSQTIDTFKDITDSSDEPVVFVQPLKEEASKKELRTGPFYDLFRHEIKPKSSGYTQEEEPAILQEPNLHLDEVLFEKSSTIEVSEVEQQIAVVEEPVLLQESELHPDEVPFTQPSTIGVIAATEPLKAIVEETIQLEEAIQLQAPEPITIPETLPEPTPVKLIPVAEELTPVKPIPVVEVPVVETKTTFQSRLEETTPKPIIKSALFASLMEHPVIETATFIVREPEEAKTELASPPTSIENKNNGHTVFGLGKLGQIFNRDSTPHEKTVEEVSPKANGHEKKTVEKVSPKTNGHEKKGSFLTNSIKDLPTTDYSSLFQ
jgi:cytoskeletal protein CcmA (bactofilin family)